MPEHTNPPGKSNATASLVLGIIAVVFWFFGYSSILSVILGIVGLIQASKAKELGYLDAIRTAGGDADIFLDGLSSNSKTSSVLHRAHVAK